MSPIPDPPLDLIEYISGVPDAEFARKVGRYHRDFFVESCGLQPDDRVLDVGCGVGRIAGALAETLSPCGSYEGIDISERAVDWCRENIGGRYPNFRFQHADIFNEFYNPRGPARARRYRFPFESASFDFVFLMSVFTHLLPRDLHNYLGEVSRVMKRGGRCAMTFFLHDRASAEFIRAGKSAFQLPCRYGRSLAPAGTEPTYGDCLTETLAEPERVVAHERASILDRIAACGMRVDRDLPGTWSGREGTGFQDTVVATKVGPVSLRVRLERGMRFEGLRELAWRFRTSSIRSAWSPAGWSARVPRA